MSLKLATKALHAGHDVKQTQGTRAVFQFINQHHMSLMTLSMQQIYFLYPSRVIYTQDLITPLMMF
jgi:hypothetical protein